MKFTKIEIAWPIKPEDDKLIGFCTIYEGENLNHLALREPGGFKIEVTQRSVNISGQTYVSLPPMSKKEEEEIMNMARHYWMGRFADRFKHPCIYRWEIRE